MYKEGFMTIDDYLDFLVGYWRVFTPPTPPNYETIDAYWRDCHSE